MNRLNKTEFATSISLMEFMFPKNLINQSLSNFTAAGVVPMAAVNCLPVHQSSADYIFSSFGIIEFIFNYLKVEYGC